MHRLDWNIRLPLVFGDPGAQILSLNRARAQDPLRPEFEAFIQQRFYTAHQADVQHFMPELFGMSDRSGILCAVAGVRHAACGPLFLELYLDASIEHMVAAAAGRVVHRQGIAEVGNLAASTLGSGRLSIITITWLLAMAGLEWVAFTGNAGLVNSFNRLGLRPITLCPADPMRLGDSRFAWGNYYDTQPSVHVGDIRSGFLHLRQAGLFERLGLPGTLEYSTHVA